MQASSSKKKKCTSARKRQKHIDNTRCSETHALYLPDKNWPRMNQADIAVSIKRHRECATELTIDGYCDSSIVPVIRENCSDLTSLDLTLSEINEKDFTEAFGNMQKLNYLSLILYIGKDRKEPIDYQIILSSLHKGIDKIRLTFPNCDNLIPGISLNLKQTIQASFDKFTSLTYLKIHGFKLDDHIIQEISKRKSLQTLILEYCITSRDKLSFNLNLPNLLSFELQEISNFDRCLINIAQHSKKLTHLILKTSKAVNVDALKKISNLIHLEHLHLAIGTGIDSNIINCISKNCRKIKKLTLPDYKNIFGNERWIKFGKFRNLEYFNLSLSDVNDTAIIAITKNCKQLKTLHLNSCNKISENALKKLGKLVTLQVLYIAGVQNFTDSVLLEIKNLTELKCQQCPKVTDSGILHLINNSPNLNSLTAHQTAVTCCSLIFASIKMKSRVNNGDLLIIVDKNEAKHFDEWKQKHKHLDVKNFSVEGY